MYKKQIYYYINNIKLIINDVNKQDELTIMQASHLSNIEIPRFCYFDGLSISGNCRMCLVEVKNVQKPVASCAIPLVENMEIFTNSLYIYKIRESILEYLLINHPLDCPICDQAGECDLQDQAYIYGGDRSRYYEDKKVAIDKECGPFLTTLMTRCIHCTRCVRFYNEIVGVDILGVLGRGNNMEISFYVKNLMTSELSGNLADICPVGAILTKSYIFQKRSWELYFLSTFDVIDTFGSLIRIDVFGNKIYRILPRSNLYLNEEWITDRARFFFDGCFKNRIFYPVVSENVRNKNVAFSVSWHYIFAYIQQLIYIISKKKNFIFNVNIGNILEIESILTTKEFFEHLGFNFIASFQQCFSDKNFTDFSFPFFIGSYSNLTKVKFLFLVAFNVRMEIPLLNLKFRKIFLKKNTKFAVFSNIDSLNFFFKSLGFSVKSFFSFFEGRLTICKQFNNNIVDISKKVIFFSYALYKKVKYNFLIFVQTKLKIFVHNLNSNVLYTDVSLLNSNEIGFQKEKKSFMYRNKKTTLNYNIMCENSEFIDEFSSTITLSQNSHIILEEEKKRKKTQINLSSKSFLENNGTYFNLEGRLLKTRKFLLTKKINIFKNTFVFFLFMKKIGSIFFYNVLSIRQRLLETNPLFKYTFYLNLTVIESLNKSIFVNNKLIKKKGLHFLISLYLTNMLLKKQNPYQKDLITKSSLSLTAGFQRIYTTFLASYFETK